MLETCLSNARIVTPAGIVENGWLTVADRKIVEIGYGVPAAAGPIDLDGCWLLPGFVDLHVHGGRGGFFQSGLPEQMAAALAFHRSHGTTTMLASLVTAPLEAMERSVKALTSLVDDGRLAGVHLEGPFLSNAHRGVHDPAWLRNPTTADVDRLLAAGHGAARTVTLAPELPGGLAAVRRIVEAGAIAAVGHTDASYDITRGSVDAGATVATHLFNGMRPVRHRDPGPIPALLNDPRITVELIVDQVHLHPAVVRLVVDHVGVDRVALVTDATVAAGMGDGEYVVGGVAIRVSRDVARTAGDGRLAGSTLTMDAALRNLIGIGVAVPEAARAAATTPARVLGLGDRVGALSTGLDADLVVLDDGFGPVAVMSKGRWVSPPAWGDEKRP